VKLAKYTLQNLPISCLTTFLYLVSIKYHRQEGNVDPAL